MSSCYHPACIISSHITGGLWHATGMLSDNTGMLPHLHARCASWKVKNKKIQSFEANLTMNLGKKNFKKRLKSCVPSCRFLRKRFVGGAGEAWWPPSGAVDNICILITNKNISCFLFFVYNLVGLPWLPAFNIPPRSEMLQHSLRAFKWFVWFFFLVAASCQFSQCTINVWHQSPRIGGNTSLVVSAPRRCFTQECVTMLRCCQSLPPVGFQLGLTQRREWFSADIKCPL